MIEEALREIADVVGKEKFVETIKDEKPDILALSTLLTSTMMKAIENPKNRIREML